MPRDWPFAAPQEAEVEEVEEDKDKADKRTDGADHHPQETAGVAGQQTG
jgi:hypothetical protein